MRFWPTWRSYLPLLALLVFPLMAAAYSFLNKPAEKVYLLVTELDRATPFVPVFAVPYLLWIFYILAVLVYFSRKDLGVYYQTLVVYVICACVCYGVYMTFQTTVPRPEVIGDGFVYDLMRFVYMRDQPFNCFPSIHCFSSYLMMRALRGSGFSSFWNRIVIYGMSSTIILSTLFVKQHVVLDAISAILLVEVVYWLVSKAQVVVQPMFSRRRLEAKVPSRM